MHNIEEVFIKLQSLVKMKSQEDIAEFERIVWDLASTNNPDIIKRLLYLFDDNCLYPEVMYSLVHAVEQCPLEQYLSIILNALSFCIVRCPMWIETIYNRILNDPSSLELFRQNMYLAPKKSLIKLFDVMATESPHHTEIIKELRSELEKFPS